MIKYSALLLALILVAAPSLRSKLPETIGQTVSVLSSRSTGIVAGRAANKNYYELTSTVGSNEHLLTLSYMEPQLFPVVRSTAVEDYRDSKVLQNSSIHLLNGSTQELTKRPGPEFAINPDGNRDPLTLIPISAVRVALLGSSPEFNGTLPYTQTLSKIMNTIGSKDAVLAARDFSGIQRQVIHYPMMIDAEVSKFPPAYVFVFVRFGEKHELNQALLHIANIAKRIPYPALASLIEEVSKIPEQGQRYHSLAALWPKPFFMSLDLVHEAATRHNIVPVFVLPPPLATHNLLFLSQREQVVSYVKRLGDPVLDLSDLYSNYRRNEVWVSGRDPHPNYFANQLLAGALTQWLANELKKKSGHDPS